MLGFRPAANTLIANQCHAALLPKSPVQHEIAVHLIVIWCRHGVRWEESEPIPCMVKDAYARGSSSSHIVCHACLYMSNVTNIMVIAKYRAMLRGHQGEQTLVNTT